MLRSTRPPFPHSPRIPSQPVTALCPRARASAWLRGEGQCPALLRVWALSAAPAVLRLYRPLQRSPSTFCLACSECSGHDQGGSKTPCFISEDRQEAEAHPARRPGQHEQQHGARSGHGAELGGGDASLSPRSPHRSCKQPGSCVLQGLQDQGQQQALGTAPPPGPGSLQDGHRVGALWAEQRISVRGATAWPSSPVTGPLDRLRGTAAPLRGCLGEGQHWPWADLGSQRDPWEWRGPLRPFRSMTRNPFRSEEQS